MNTLLKIGLLLLTLIACKSKDETPLKIVDVHIHGEADPSAQMANLEKAGVYFAAISTSWDIQESYRKNTYPKLLFGLMFPCPLGKVPYGGKACFENGKDWPDISWVEDQIKAGKIDYFGELLNQYYGITPSDSMMTPYYQLAIKYNLPIGIHTGGAGPDHGSPNFQWELGDPALLRPILQEFPEIRLWIMHSGDQYFEQTIEIMREFSGVYADISVIANPDIVDQERFYSTMKAFYEADLEDRLMFGSDNGNLEKMVTATESLDFLNQAQKDKLFFKNASIFFDLN